MSIDPVLVDVKVEHGYFCVQNFTSINVIFLRSQLVIMINFRIYKVFSLTYFLALLL